MFSKITFFVAVLIMVCRQNAVNVSADNIECAFRDRLFFYPTRITIYNCEITSIEQNSIQNVINGKHQNGHSDSDIKALYHSFGSAVHYLNEFDSTFCDRFLNLEKIDFANLRPAILGEDALFNCPNLEHFDLKETSVVLVPESFFSKSVNLKLLRLESGKLETLPENVFENLKELEQLILSLSRKVFLPSNIFKALTKLTFLRLDGNNLSILNPAWFETLAKLEELNVAKNQIEELPKDIFVPLENLKKLRLEENKITTIHADSFGTKPFLTIVNLNRNQISAIDEKFIENTAVADIKMWKNICNQEDIESREELREKLQQCFDNYQPRQQ